MTDIVTPEEAARWARVRALFHEILDAPATERAARLARAESEAPGLRAEVEALLAADAALDSDAGPAAFLATPPDAAWLLAAVDAPDGGARPALPDPRLGQVLGG